MDRPASRSTSGGKLTINRTMRRWRRRVPAVLAVGLLALVPLGTGAGADSARGAGAVSPQDEFVSGSGRARASLFEIVPRTGGLTIPFNFGKALVTYQGLSATATSGGLKPPSQSSADDGGCGGGFRPPGGGNGGGQPPGTPPPPKGPGGGNGPPTSFPWVSTVSVSTADQDAAKGRHVDQGHFPDGSPISGAMERQDAAATADPSGTASTTHGRIAFGPVAEVLHGRTEATAGVVEHKARLAHAVTTMDRLSLLGGMIVLNDVRWEATQRTGEGERADGAFSVGSVLFQGKPLPAPPSLPGGPGSNGPALPDPLAALNTAIAPTGIGLVAPHFELAGAVAQVTPMSLRFSDSALGRQVLGPIVGDLQPLRDPIVGGLLAASCDFGTAVLVADVAAGILTGSGGISFDFGGVTATTEGERYDNPFAGGVGGDQTGPGVGDGGLPDIGPEPAPPTASSPPVTDAGSPAAGDATGLGAPAGESGAGSYGPGTAGGPGSVPGSGPATTGAAPAGDEAAFAAPAGAFGSSSRHLPGHKGGRGIAVAALALLTIGALAAADAFQLRRASRSIS